MGESNPKRLIPAICLVLAIVTAALYWPLTSHEFINLDDRAYIAENPNVQAGLTWSGVVWALRTGYAATWHPLTWISHMLDCQVFGLNPGGHHFIGLLLHTANTVLLFLLLQRMTGAAWRSAAVAALFAWHPLHVQSVAWACERKDLLSAFFWILTMMAYVEYSRKPGWFRYSLALLLFACGLMSKAMVVTLPFVLLLVDFWPLGRIPGLGSKTECNSALNSQPATLGRLVLEKLPFFALTVGACVVTYLTQKGGGAMWSPPLSSRIANALVAYLSYVSKSFWPAGLAVVYPYPRHWNPSLVITAGLVLVIWSILFLRLARHRPYLMIGWLWFLGTLVPTIGLVQVGSQSMADRFTYIPSIGLFILVVWGLNGLLDCHPAKIKIGAALAGLSLAGCVVCTWNQIGYWHDSVKLFRHAAEVTTDNYVAYECLGKALEESGRIDDALSCYAAAVQAEAHFPPAQYKLGMALMQKGRFDEAADHLAIAMELVPHNPEGQYNLGTALMSAGRIPEAIAHFTAARDDNPKFAPAYAGLGTIFLKQGKLDDAAAQFSQAVALEPEDAGAHFNLGTVLLMQSKADQAAIQLSEAVRLNPASPESRKNLAIALMTLGRSQEAIAHFSETVRLRPGDPEARFDLGLALLNCNKPSEAAAQFEELVRSRPADPKAQYHLALALHHQGKTRDAISHLHEALRLDPDYPDALNELAWLLATAPDAEVRAGADSIQMAERACELTRHQQATMLITLAAAYAERGRFSEAIAAAEKGRDLATAGSQPEVAAKAAKLVDLFRSGQPFRESP